MIPEMQWSIQEIRELSYRSEFVMAVDVAYCLLKKDGEPSNYQDAINSSNSSSWIATMQEKVETLHKNQTWKLVPLQPRRKAIENKWVYKIKHDSND